jgi:tetratricopeptide (TPR) repeat protein
VAAAARHAADAASLGRQALAQFREQDVPWYEAEVLNSIGETLLATGQPGQARDHHAAALTLTRRTGALHEQARAHRGLAAACHATGELEQASRHWQQALDIYTDLGVPEAAEMRASSDPSADPANTPATLRDRTERDRGRNAATAR